MSLQQQHARLNVLLECFSECAIAVDIETLLATLSQRLCWAIDFDHCAAAIIGRDGLSFWQATQRGVVEKIAASDMPAREREWLHLTLARGSIVFDGSEPGYLGVPLLSATQVIAALCLCRERGRYDQEDYRLAQRVGPYLGTLIARIHLEQVARRLSERKDELLALLGHELRNPLAPIVTAATLLKLRSGGSPAKEILIIERHAQHMVRLVDDLLDVARLIRGNVILNRATVELAVVVVRAIDLSSSLIDGHRHHLRVDVPQSGLLLDVDEWRMAQVFANLLNNAARYTDPGGQLEIAARREAAEIVIEVTDNGIGIASDALGDIFEAFTQRTPRSLTQGGLGLGLVVVKQITELHGGSITVESAGANCGSKFIVRVPCLPPEATLPERPLEPSTLVHADYAQRVLLVDDNEDALDMLATMLKGAGHVVSTAHDGGEALSMLDHFHPSVAVLDLGLPVMDGCELAVKIREDMPDASPYLVAVTGYGQESDRERTRAAGFDAHLVKPVDAAELLRVIAAVPA
jgi:signal transduction histidine kinase